MRLIKNHIVNPVNEKLEVRVMDERGADGANHVYEIVIGENTPPCYINFQDGPIGENGVNGVTQEAMLAVIIDRLRSFQSGPLSCRENAIALTKCEEALQWLHYRTRERMERNVEGRNAA